MPYANTPTIGAGSILAYEDQDNLGSYIDLDDALNIGQVGEQSDQVEVTPIRAKTREYIAGLDTPPDKQITFNHVPANTSYQMFLGLVDQRLNINMRVTYESGDIAIFNIALLGRMMEEAEGNTQLKMTVYGKQSGATAWSEAA